VVDIGEASDDFTDVARHNEARPGLGAISRIEVIGTRKCCAASRILPHTPTSQMLLIARNTFQPCGTEDPRAKNAPCSANWDELKRKL